MLTPPARMLAAALVGATTLGLVGIASTPAAAAQAAYVVELGPQTDSYYAIGYQELPGTVSRSTTGFSITLPTEYFELTPEYRDYRLDSGIDFEFGEVTTVGNVVTGTFPSLAPNTAYTLVIASYANEFRSSSEAYFSFVTGSTVSAPSTLTLNHASLTTSFIDRGATWNYLGVPPLVVAPGDLVSFEGAPGLFTAGPNNDWGSSEVFQSSRVSSVEDFSVSSTFPDLTVTPDGSLVTMTVPGTHWSYTPDANYLIDVFFDVFDQGVGGATSIYVQYPIIYSDRPAPQVDRVAGPDRFTVSQNIARESYPFGTTTAYITNGLNYPDALSASPAAAFEGGPLLLTLPTALPAGLEQTLIDLGVERIVVVGGPNSVNAAVYNQLSSIVSGNISRLGGTDRFDASRNIARTVFEGIGAPFVYLATGLNFPDALSASAAAGRFSVPVILINGSAPTLDAPTLQLLNDLNTQFVTIAGGPNSVSNGIETQLNDLGYLPYRLSGSDRFEASSNISRDGFPTAERVFLATGFNFPDALAGAAWAAAEGAPLIVVPGTCVPQRVLRDLQGYRVSDVTILGGPNSVSVAVENLTPCAGYAWSSEAPLSSTTAPMDALRGESSRAPHGLSPQSDRALELKLDALNRKP